MSVAAAPSATAVRGDIGTAISARIRADLKRQDHDVAWLAAQTGITIGRLRNLLAGRREFTCTDLGNIAVALGSSTASMIAPQVEAACTVCGAPFSWSTPGMSKWNLNYDGTVVSDAVCPACQNEGVA